MNNKFKAIIFSTIAGVTTLGTTSCSSDFLDEDYKSGYLSNYLDTEEGLDALSASLYGNIRFFFAYDWAHGITQLGVDEFSVGTDASCDMWNNYDARLAPYVVTVNGNTPTAANLWDQMYYGIASANTVIAKGEDVFSNADTKKQCMGEAYFLRGYNYLRLVMQYGDVVLKTEPSEGVERYFQRSSVEEVTKQIVSDLSQAHDLLPASKTRGWGSWTRYTAAHFLAKALLFRCSERNDSWNSSYKDADLSQIISLCDEVITACPLEADYNNVFGNWTGIDCALEGSNEILMSAQFNGNVVNIGDAQGRFGNRVYSFMIAQYSNMGYMTRTGATGLDYQRDRPTEYTLNVFDVKNDARFWKSFKTTYTCNSPSDDVAMDDLSIIYIINSKDDHRYDDLTFGPNSFSYTDDVTLGTNKLVPHAFILYQNGKYVLNGESNPTQNNRFPSVSKYLDGTIIPKSTESARDGVLARTGETYLIKAEAQVRQGKYQEAIETVNKLRARGQWKDGEDRSFHTDGSKAANSGKDEIYQGYCPVNSYYASTGIEQTTAASNLQIANYMQLPAEDEAILAKLGVTSDYDRMLHFILNERTRELCGELLRWDDLSRTKTLLLRAKTFNTEAAQNLKEYHLLRPIPQAFIDGLLNEDGSNLSQEQKDALQNPGY